jgi:hypothetical protein
MAIVNNMMCDKYNVYLVCEMFVQYVGEITYDFLLNNLH